MDRPKLIQKLRYNSRTEKVSPIPMGKGVILEDEMKDSKYRIKHYINQDDPTKLVRVAHLKATNKQGLKMLGSKQIYYFCKEEDSKEVERLLSIYADDTRNDHKLEYPIGLGSAIVDVGGEFGWHCVDKDFVFFTNPMAIVNYLKESMLV